MRSIQRSALVPYTAEQMFAIVNDVRRYSDFLPWCSSSQVLSESPVEMVATIEMSANGMQRSFTTRNTLEPPNSIKMKQQQGVFTSLNGEWLFAALGDDGCKVSLDLNFDMPKAMMMMGVGRVFDKAADRMVEVFCQRATQIYD